MGIYDVTFGGYGSFTSDYRINNIPKAPDNKEETSFAQATEAKKPQENIADINKAPKSIDPNSVSITFNKNDEFGYIGSKKDINNLDMEKAISDMKQDSILQEYNYFVGNSNNIFNSEDGVVIAK